MPRKNSSGTPPGQMELAVYIDLRLPIERCVGVHRGPDCSSLTAIVVLEFAVRPGSGDHEIL